MRRVNIPGEDGSLHGWFDPEQATSYQEDTWWDGSNNISVATGSQWDHELLYYTAGEFWVLHRWSQWQGTGASYEFVYANRAREWLLLNHHDEAVEQHFGPIEAERGPEGRRDNE